MMDRMKSDQGQLFYEFHLGDAVPEDHLVRKIDAALDLSCSRSILASQRTCPSLFVDGSLDAIGNAIMIAKIATGEIEDITTEDGKNAAAVALGRMGGKARAAGMSAKKRKEIAKKAAEKRWGK